MASGVRSWAKSICQWSCRVTTMSRRVWRLSDQMLRSPNSSWGTRRSGAGAGCDDGSNRWYTDRRNPDVGVLNRDEAAILHNTARLVRGQPCLEIGSWLGWSAVHLALGSGVLDVIDPTIADPTFAERIRQSCKAIRRASPRRPKAASVD